MDVVSTLINAIPLLLVTVLGGWLLKDRLDRLEAKVDARPSREEFDGRTGDLGRRLDRLESEIAAMRSDLTQIALAVGARTRPQTG